MCTLQGGRFIIMLTEEDTKQHYPEPIRRVAVYDEKNDKVIELINKI